MTIIDEAGFRHGIVIVLTNENNQVFWAHRIKQRGWQFPQGGLLEQESEEAAMFRELHEEVGLHPEDVQVIAATKDPLFYRLPSYLVRSHLLPLCVGQKQRWYLLRLLGPETKIQFDTTNKPEFDAYRWVNYWVPTKSIVFFKRSVYKKALSELSPVLFEPSKAE